MRYFFNQKPEIGKTEKSKFLDIFVLFMCTLKIFCDVWTPSEYLKNSPKIFFPEKKAIVLFFREKKKKIEKFGRSAEIGQIFFGDKNLCIRQICTINIY